MGNTGILLLNFGGPQTPGEVRPFLFRLFADPRILQMHGCCRYPLALWIALRRARETREQYRAIGGRSPINEMTDRQAAALAERFPNTPVRVGLRYSRPTIAEGLDSLARAGATRVIALPLYPHFSYTTTDSAFHALRRAAQAHPAIRVDTIDRWYDHPAFVHALRQRITERLGAFHKPPHLLFSAHSLPMKHVEKGDPYPRHIEAAVSAVMEGLAGVASHSLAYQSRLGRKQWLEPETASEIRRLASEGVGRLLVCPISFVGDHLETLFEIDITYRAVAEAAGIERFERTEALNDFPPFIDALATIISDRMNSDDEG